MIFKEKQKNKGITLIALVITIIVLLILAGVTIATLLGDNGVLTKATEAKNEQADATVEEAIKLAWNEYQMMLNEPTGKNESGTKIASTSKVKIQGPMTFWQFLEEEKHYINEQGVIDVKTLVGETLSRGNGTDGKDVYKIEETENNGYVLVYCDENNNRKELSTFEPGDSEILEETDESYFDITEDGVISLKNFDDYYHNESEWQIENVVIPKEVNGIEVVEIGEAMFKASDDILGVSNSISNNLKTVVIPDTVKVIGKEAFEYCKELTKIEIPNSVEVIYAEAFTNCSSLSVITIPNNIKSIGQWAFAGCTSIENITIPSSVINMESWVFDGWNENQTIYIKTIEENKTPSYWNSDWNERCNANIILEYDPEYFTFAQEYLSNKNQEELEELVLKTGGYPGTFDQFLTGVGMTRDEWEQQGTDEGMTYIEWLKDILVYGDNGFSWVRVEYEVSKSGGAGKTLGELETLFAQKYGAETLDELLAKDNMTKEQFEEEIKNQGFRTEEDYLKYHLYYPV